MYVPCPPSYEQEQDSLIKHDKLGHFEFLLFYRIVILFCKKLISCQFERLLTIVPKIFQFI